MTETFNLQEWQRSDAEYPEVNFDNAADLLMAAYHNAQQSQWSHDSMCQLCIMADAVFERLVCSGVTQAVSLDEWKKLCKHLKEAGLMTSEWHTIGQRLVADYGLPAREWPEL